MIATRSLVPLAALALTASLADAATTYRVTCVYDNAKCSGGKIKLRQFLPNNACDSADCAPFANKEITAFGTFHTCTTNPVSDSAKLLKGQSYVLVENYESGCSGDPKDALAVVGDGLCVPNGDGKSSYKVTIAADNAVTWMQYTDAMCQSNATTTNFKSSEVDRNTCVSDSMKVLVVNTNNPSPASSGSSSSRSLTAFIAANIAASIAWVWA
ncbi:hypothetical protein ATCC90586_001804 [Pythium insidiosum]|nr:hypothetical protein ATCC90586_001804 [Pythium insidiosum]